jgi:hypothetical protein
LPVLPPLPGWARIEPPVTDTDADSGAAFQAGAALAMLDARVRADVPFAGVWRRRLALKAAAASARIARRGEDEASLRDALLLRHGGDDPGPAGRLLVAWRGLDRSAPLADDSVLHVDETLQIKVDEALHAAIADVQQFAAAAQAAPFAAAQAARIVAQRPDAEILALWLADAVLAARLKWPLPLIAGALVHPSLLFGFAFPRRGVGRDRLQAPAAGRHGFPPSGTQQSHCRPQCNRSPPSPVGTRQHSLAPLPATGSQATLSSGRPTAALAVLPFAPAEPWSRTGRGTWTDRRGRITGRPTGAAGLFRVAFAMSTRLIDLRLKAACTPSVWLPQA